MKLIKKILKFLLYVLLLPVIYIAVSLILGCITVNKDNDTKESDTSIFLVSNGVHLDIIIPKDVIDSKLISKMNHYPNDNYLAFGWGDENFYLNTPTWGDLTFNNGFKALFLKSTTLMHVTRYRHKIKNWTEIKVTAAQLKEINAYLTKTITVNKTITKLDGKGYGSNDDFYKANGSYSCFKTCNSWVNSSFKESGLKACYWTPFDFGLLNKYN